MTDEGAYIYVRIISNSLHLRAGLSLKQNKGRRVCLPGLMRVRALPIGFDALDIWDRRG